MPYDKTTLSSFWLACNLPDALTLEGRGRMGAWVGKVEVVEGGIRGHYGLSSISP